MVLSYLEAYQMKNAGQISWDQYIEHLFARCPGFKHEDENKKYGHWSLRYEDPSGYSIWCWCKPAPQMIGKSCSGRLCDMTVLQKVLTNVHRLGAVRRRFQDISPSFGKRCQFEVLGVASGV